MKHLAYIVLTSFITALLTFQGCGHDVREGDIVAVPDRNSYDDSSLPEEFKTEGFVASGIFRVVIVEPGESAGKDGSNIAREAKKRAFLSLKRYLISENRIVTPNSEASLLNLVESEGKLSPVEDKSRDRTVYFFEIKKNNVREYVDGLAPKR